MDRREAILRELNVYPLWVRRNQPVPVEAEQHAHVLPASRLGGGEADTQRSAMGIVEPVLSEVEGLNPSYVSSPSDGGQEIANLDWPQLKEVVRDCTACKLRAGCTQTVFGVGDEKADWLFVGEGPGADEDAQGEPFVGQAGKLLDSMLAAIKLKRGKNVYIANIVKCRPPNNRNPEADEIAQCLPYLQRQIELIQPKLIVALGKTAATALLIKPLANRLGESTTLAKSLVMGKEATLGSLRGTLHDYHGIPLIVTYHPAYLLRSPTEKAKAWQDLCFALETIQKA
jgi:DNA polymerase